MSPPDLGIDLDAPRVRSEEAPEFGERSGRPLPPGPPWPVFLVRGSLGVAALVSLVNLLGPSSATACICLTVALAGLAASFGPGQ